MNKKKALIYLILFSHIIAVIIYHIFGYIGHYGVDDLHYAKLANDLLNGTVDYNDHFSYRFPIIILTAISYSLFGISDFASSLPPLIITISILAIVFSILNKKGYLTLTLGLSLTTFSNWFIFYSDKLMPDIYVALSVILSLYIIHQYKYKSDKNRPIIYSTLLALSLLFGFTAKGTIILIIPLLLYIFIIDIIKKRDVKFWIYSIVSGILVLSIYFITIWFLTGDFSKRFDAISQNSYLNLCSYDQQPLNILLKRIFFEFFTMMTYQVMLTGFIFIFAFIFRNKPKKHFQFNDSFSFFLIASFILFLSSNFMTVSVTAYIPMCLDPRHYLFLIPIVAIPASIIVSDYIKEKQNAISIIISLVLISFLSFFLNIDVFWKLYLPLTILFGLYYLLKKNTYYQVVFLFAFVIILLVKPLDIIFYAQKLKYWKQKEIVFKNILNKSEDYYVVTNLIQKRLGNYYNEFNENSNITFLSYDEFENDSLDNRKKMLLLNWYTRYLSGYDNNDLPYYAKKINSKDKLLYENKELNISLYELNSVSTPSKSKVEILHSFNDFEKEVTFWNQNNNDITNSIKYEGNKSIKVIEYSSTFVYPLDSLFINNSNSVNITSELYCHYLNKTDSKLVFSIENKEGVYIWNGIGINKYLKSYANWWSVKSNIIINASDIKNGSILKIYLWNSDKQSAHIDNFEVKIYEVKN